MNAPIYYHSTAYAREHGELDQYRATSFAMRICAKDIETIISARFDGMRLDRTAVTETLAIHGPDLVSILLASTVLYKSWDRRFSQSNKEWAGMIRCPDRSDSLMPIYINTHPAILDGFISLYRKAISQ